MKHAVIDPRMDAYKQIFDHKWGERLFTRTKGTALHDITFDLTYAWRLCANTHLFPWLTVDQLRGYSEGEDKGSRRFRNDNHITFVKGLADKIDRRMTRSLKREQRLQLKRCIAAIEQEAHEVNERVKIVFPGQAYWDWLIQNSEFKFSVLGSQRLSYGALYYAYEDFLVSVYKLKAKKAAYRMRRAKEFGDDFAKAFNGALRDYCWTNQKIIIARLVRNALVHANGRFTDELAPYRKTFFIEVATDDPAPLVVDKFLLVGKDIQILAPNARFLFDTLKSRVDKLVEEMLA